MLASVLSIRNSRMRPSPADIVAQALSLQMQGRLNEAAGLYQQVLRAHPRHFDALHFSGILKLQLALPDEGVKLLRAALKIRPDSAQAHLNMGIAQQSLARHADALLSFDRAAALGGNYAEAHFNRGSALQALQRYDGSLEAYDTALAIRMAYPEALSNRGNVLSALGRTAEALDSFDGALSLKPAFPECHFGKARALVSIKRHDEALVCLGHALVLRPDFTEARLSRVAVLIDLGLYEEALSDCDAVLAAEPTRAETHNMRGFLLRDLQRLPEAIIAFQRALDIDPDSKFALGNLVHSRRIACDWTGGVQEIARVVAQVDTGKPVIVPLDFSTLSGSARDQLRCATVCANAANQHGAPAMPVLQTAQTRDRRIRVAYVSPDFREHAVAFLTAGLFEHHDRTRFEIIAVALNPDIPSPTRDRLKSAFDHFIHAYDKSDHAVAMLLAKMGVDIAVDLAGPTQNSRPQIFAYRPAPVQVSYLGFPGTQGTEHIDYIIADDFVIPEDRQAFYSEKVVYLPDCFQSNDDARKISPGTSDRATAGLPDSGFVFCTFNHCFKITPEIFAIWMEMLKRVPGSVLWMVADLALAQSNLRAEARRQGVDPARLIFAERMAYADHLARLRLADLFLDSLPYNAGTNASDALWAGLPVLTCSGDAFAARMAGSLLRAVGLQDLITYDLQAYLELGTALALDAGRMGELKARLALNRQTHALFDTARFTLHLEAAYEQMWNLNNDGLPPKPIAVRAITAADVRPTAA